MISVYLGSRINFPSEILASLRMNLGLRNKNNEAKAFHMETKIGVLVCNEFDKLRAKILGPLGLLSDSCVLLSKH